MRLNSLVPFPFSLAVSGISISSGTKMWSFVMTFKRGNVALTPVPAFQIQLLVLSDLCHKCEWVTLAYVPVSANWQSNSSGHLRFRLAMPISPLAKPRPSTTATITEATEVVVTEEPVVALKKEEIRREIWTTLHKPNYKVKGKYWCVQSGACVQGTSLWPLKTPGFSWVSVFLRGCGRSSSLKLFYEAMNLVSLEWSYDEKDLNQQNKQAEGCLFITPSTTTIWDK